MAEQETTLVLRTCNREMKSHGGFVWPMEGPVEAPDWKPTKECGHGLHGWLLGKGDWSLRCQDSDAVWLVIEVSTAEIVDLGGKVKFPRGTVLQVYKNWPEALAFIEGRCGVSPASSATGYSGHASATGDHGHASATGYYGHASATGYYGHASATGDSGHASATGNHGHASATGDSGHASATGDHGHASATGDHGHASATGYSGHASATGNHGHASATGYYGHASATGDSGHASATGYCGHASATGYSGHASATGDHGHASATGDCGHASATGDSGHASATGYCGCAFAGFGGKAKASKSGAFAIAWFDATENRSRVIVGTPGDHGIKADTWYRVDGNGNLIEVPQ